MHVTSCRSTSVVPLHLGFVMVGRILYIVERRDVMGSVTDYVISIMPMAAGLGHVVF